jgi:hypothetical protein
VCVRISRAVYIRSACGANCTVGGGGARGGGRGASAQDFARGGGGGGGGGLFFLQGKIFVDKVKNSNLSAVWQSHGILHADVLFSKEHQGYSHIEENPGTITSIILLHKCICFLSAIVANN